MDAPGGDDDTGRLAVWWCPLGGGGTVGAWRLAVCDARQAVWS